MSAILALVFPLSLIAGAVSDLIRYEIPNALPAFLLAGYVGYAAVSGASLSAFGVSLASGLVVLVCGAILFRCGLLGGGDVKMLAAAAPWVGWAGLPWFLLLVALWGGALAVVVFVGRLLNRGISRSGPHWWQRLFRGDGGIPYGVAICAGGLSMFGQTGALSWIS